MNKISGIYACCFDSHYGACTLINKVGVKHDAWRDGTFADLLRTNKSRLPTCEGNLLQTEDKLYCFVEVPQGNDLSIVVRPKGLYIHQPKLKTTYIAWRDGPSELL
jgi:hypothetical protein